MSGIRERLSTTIYELLHCVTRGFTGGLQPRFANTPDFQPLSLIVANRGSGNTTVQARNNGSSVGATATIAAGASSTVTWPAGTIADQIVISGNTSTGGVHFDIAAIDNFTLNGSSAAPTISALHGGSVNYIAGGAAVVLDGDAAAADADSANLAGGTLRVAIYANEKAAEDVLEVGAVGPITLSSGNISHSGTAIGSVSQIGNNGNDLLLSLNANATPVRVTDLLRAIRYYNTNTTDPDLGGRSVRWQLSDGGTAPPFAYTTMIKPQPPTAPPNTITVDFASTTPALTTNPTTFTSGGFTFTITAPNAGPWLSGNVVPFDLPPNATYATMQANGVTPITVTMRRSDNVDFALVSLVLGNVNKTDSLSITARDGGGNVIDTRSLPALATRALVYPSLSMRELRITGDNWPNDYLQMGFFDSLVYAVANLPPAVGSLNNDNVLFQQSMGAIALDAGGNATVTDSDSANFNGGSLRAEIAVGLWSGEDVLSVANGVNNITVSGSNVSESGVLIGTINAAGTGSGGLPLIVNFNSSATPARVQNLVRALRYNNTSGNPDLSDRLVAVSVSDGGGAPVPTHNINVRVTPAPLTGNVQTDVDFTGLSVGPNVTALNHDGYTFSLSGGFQRYLGAGIGVPNAPGLQAGDTGISSQTLTITRQDAADFQLTNLIVRNLAAESARTIETRRDGFVVETLNLVARGNRRLSFNGANVDEIRISGVTGQTTAGLVVIDDLVRTVPNTAPTATASAGTTSYDENAAAVVVDPTVTVTDGEGAWNGGFVRAEITAGVVAGDRISFVAGGTVTLAGLNAVAHSQTIGVLSAVSVNDNAQLTITLNGNATTADVQQLLRLFRFDHQSENPGNGTRTVTFTVSDAGALTSTTGKGVTTVPVPDAPIISNLNGDTPSDPQPGNPIAFDEGQDVVVGDFDTTQFNGGRLLVQCDAARAASFSLVGSANSGGDGVVVVGETINASGVGIGTVVAAGQAGAPLEISLNSQATASRVQTVLRSLRIAAANAGLNPCSVALRDGPAGSAEAAGIAVTVEVGIAADLSISKTDHQTIALEGQPVSYTVVVSNVGASSVNATVTDVMPTWWQDVLWSCVGAGGAVCTTTGSGNLSDTVSLPSASSVTYTLTGVPGPSDVGATIVNVASVAVSNPHYESTSADNTATDVTDTDLIFRNGQE